MTNVIPPMVHLLVLASQDIQAKLLELASKTIGYRLKGSIRNPGSSQFKFTYSLPIDSTMKPSLNREVMYLVRFFDRVSSIDLDMDAVSLPVFLIFSTETPEISDGLVQLKENFTKEYGDSIYGFPKIFCYSLDKPDPTFNSFSFQQLQKMDEDTFLEILSDIHHTILHDYNP
ncbi:MAG: hypothetical protein D6732_07035 [Methanobacteriota archaeon]|nr:MAG: hypothetical protein D6732_07035 [Euryarchaeota archaeon]